MEVLPPATNTVRFGDSYLLVPTPGSSAGALGRRCPARCAVEPPLARR